MARSLIEELRSKQSRDNRDLLDRAADRIEELEKAKYIYGNVDYSSYDLMIEMKKNDRLQKESDRLKAEVERLKAAYNGLVSDVKTYGVRDVCFICKAYTCQPDCEYVCTDCKLNCPCRECREYSHWKWRGES